jgi:hypothetical protein
MACWPWRETKEGEREREREREREKDDGDFFFLKIIVFNNFLTLLTFRNWHVNFFFEVALLAHQIFFFFDVALL